MGCVAARLRAEAVPADEPEQPVSDAGPSDPASPGADVPQAPQSARTTATVAPTPADDAGDSGHGRKIKVTTDVLAVEIDTRGGTIARVDLRSYPVSNDKRRTPSGCSTTVTRNATSLPQSGLTGPRSAPNHHAQFEFDANAYELADGMDGIDVPLRWRSDDGVEVTRTYRFARDRYVVDVQVDVVNGSDEEWHGALYGQLQRGEPESSGGLFRTYTYTGGILSGRRSSTRKSIFRTWRARTSPATSPAAGWR